jgi:hypothetical protein
MFSETRAIPPKNPLESLMTQSDKPANEPAPDRSPEPTSSFSLTKYYLDKLENARKHLPEAARRLKAAGVRSVHIDYDGCGDSGQIESIGYLDQEGESIDPCGKVSMTEDQLMDLFYDLIEARHPGWENNDGAFGELEWNLIDDTLRHTHNDRFTDYDTTEHQGL